MWSHMLVMPALKKDCKFEAQHPSTKNNKNKPIFKKVADNKKKMLYGQENMKEIQTKFCYSWVHVLTPIQRDLFIKLCFKSLRIYTQTLNTHSVPLHINCLHFHY